MARDAPRRKFFRPEQFVYRTAGLPVAIAANVSGSGNAFDRALARAYWRPRHFNQWLELVCAVLLVPISLPASMAIYTARNGRIVRRREGVGIATQLREQLSAYCTAGILPPWYYAFELFRHRLDAGPRDFLQRYETHGGVYQLLRGNACSPLNDKKAFADFCSACGLPHVSYVACLDGNGPPPDLPPCDLFVKPVVGRGGKGAERWDYAGSSRYISPDHGPHSRRELTMRLVERARKRPLLVQPRLHAHRALGKLSPGALPTVRVLTCLDESGTPEVVEAVFRMAIGHNETVDNIHAGGIAAEISIGSGRLGPASNLGFDASLGWLSAHPDTGAAIRSVRLPFWPEVKALALRAHRAFGDRIIIGWDIAILDDGPILIEGNSSPDLDLHQRPARRGLVHARVGQLLAAQLTNLLGPAAADPNGSAEGAGQMTTTPSLEPRVKEHT